MTSKNFLHADSTDCVALQHHKVGVFFSIQSAPSHWLFLKKAIGKISFKCDKGLMIKEKVGSLNSQKIKSTMWIDSIGVDESGQEVSKFKFNWSILLKK